MSSKLDNKTMKKGMEDLMNKAKEMYSFVSTKDK